MDLSNLFQQDKRKQGPTKVQESSPAHENQISFTPPTGIPPVSLPAGQNSLQRMLDPKAEEERPIQHKLEDEEKTLQKKENENKSGMPDTLKTGIENLSGTSMDNVQVHYNSSQPAHWQASAFAQGNNIHLGPGQEKHLPHEAWHVAQQRQGRVKPTMQMKGGAVNDDPALEKEADEMGTKALSTSMPQNYFQHKSINYTHANTTAQLKALSIRFQEDTNLDAVSDGKKVYKMGSSGMAITKVQQALAELGYLATNQVSGSIDAHTEGAIKKFQIDNASDPNGTIDQPFFTKLDSRFTNYSIEAKVIKGQKPSVAPSSTEWATGTAPKELLNGTRSLNDTERTAINEAINTSPKKDPITGSLPVFKENTVDGKYGERIKKTANAIIDSQYKRLAKGKGALRSDSKNLHSWKDIETVAAKSKEETDKVFGQYAVRSSFKSGTNLFDGWEDKEKKMNASKAFQDNAAEWRVDKIMNGSAPIKKIDTEHGAIQSRAAEATIVKSIRDEIVKNRRAELLEIHKAWPGYAGNGQVYLQRFKDPDDTKNKEFMWHNFRMIIHEYIHTLEHSEHVKYRKTMKEKEGGFTLREGTTDYFTKIAWNNVTVTDSLRSAVEGPFHDPKVKHPVSPLNTYGESENAERAASIVGIRNICAAFFLGLVQLIGKK